MRFSLLLLARPPCPIEWSSSFLFSPLLLLIYRFVDSAAAVANAGSCPNVKVLDTLDLSRYPGIWYEVASQNLAFLSSCKCSVYNFTCTSTGCASFDDHFTCNKDVSKPGSDYDLVTFLILS